MQGARHESSKRRESTTDLRTHKFISIFSTFLNITLFINRQNLMKNYDDNNTEKSLDS